jgi:hypothetical protein
LSWANASSRSRSSHQAAALSRFAPMTNFSIPSSTPVTGRISTKSSGRSRSSNNASASFFEAFTVAKAIGPSTLRFFNAQRSTDNAQRSIQTVGCWRLDVGRWVFSSIWRVKGAWWPSRSSKPLSIPQTQGRGRFDSYPLRQFKFGVRFLMFDLQSPRQFSFKRQTSNVSKGGDSRCRVSKFAN